MISKKRIPYICFYQNIIYTVKCVQCTNLNYGTTDFFIYIHALASTHIPHPRSFPQVLCPPLSEVNFCHLYTLKIDYKQIPNVVHQIKYCDTATIQRTDLQYRVMPDFQITPGGHLMKAINSELRTSMPKQETVDESRTQTTERQGNRK